MFKTFSDFDRATTINGISRVDQVSNVQVHQSFLLELLY